jgi:glycosyltransferase involved in cell wall biosynthesis
MSGSAAYELSVVIASHNRRERLRACLEALSRQDHPAGSFEAIVADDGSTDGTAEMVEAFEAPFPLRVLRLAKAGKPAALNAAIAVAEAPACLFLDDDVIASPELVAEHAAAHREQPMTLGIGALTQRAPSGRDWYLQAYATAWNERYRELEDRQADWTDCYGGNFSAPLAALREVDGFDAELEAVEDIELGYRLQAAGCLPRFLPRARALHDDVKDRAATIAATRRYGAFCAAFAERRPRVRPQLLGWFLRPTPRDVTLRRLMLTLRIGPAALAVLGRVIPGAGRRQVWYGFIARYTFWLGVRSAISRTRWRQTTRGVPVLMYHAFTDSGERGRYVMPARSLARQLRLLRALGYRVISLEALIEALGADRPPPSRSVALTIDDGYADNLKVAAPVLARARAAATIFLVSRRIGERADWTEEGVIAGRRLLSAAQIEELHRGGRIAFGAHTRTHCSLPAEADAALAEQIDGSRRDLEELLGEPVTSFAFPFGRFDGRAVAAVREAGFDGACSVESRPARLGDDPLLIPRIEVKGEDSLLGFLRKLWFGGG